jgi:hypothetical protein
VLMLIDQLNRDFGNVREILESSGSSLTLALIKPAIDRFADTLDAVALARPNLSAKCQSLETDLSRFLDPPSESEWHADDSDVPF